MLNRRRLVYIRLTPEQIHFRLVGTRREIIESPLVAYERRSKRILTLGRQASEVRRPDVEVNSGFGSSRGIIRDLDVAEIALRYWLEVLLELRWTSEYMWLQIELVIHPLDVPGEGFTPFELWALSHLGRQLRADHVVVWLGEELSDAQLSAGVHRQRKAIRTSSGNR